jgi:hypothetical protein
VESRDGLAIAGAKDARWTEGAGQQSVAPVGGEDEGLGTCLGVIVCVEGDLGVRDTLVSVNKVLLARVDDARRRGVDELGNTGILARLDNVLGAGDVDELVD